MKRLLTVVAISAMVVGSAVADGESTWLVKQCENAVCRWTSKEQTFNTPTRHHLNRLYDGSQTPALSQCSLPHIQCRYIRSYERQNDYIQSDRVQLLSNPAINTYGWTCGEVIGYWGGWVDQCDYGRCSIEEGKRRLKVYEKKVKEHGCR